MRFYRNLRFVSALIMAVCLFCDSRVEFRQDGAAKARARRIVDTILFSGSYFITTEDLGDEVVPDPEDGPEYALPYLYSDPSCTAPSRVTASKIKLGGSAMSAPGHAESVRSFLALFPPIKND